MDSISNTQAQDVHNPGHRILGVSHRLGSPHTDMHFPVACSRIMRTNLHAAIAKLPQALCRATGAPHVQGIATNISPCLTQPTRTCLVPSSQLRLSCPHEPLRRAPERQWLCKQTFSLTPGSNATHASGRMLLHQKRGACFRQLHHQPAQLWQ